MAQAASFITSKSDVFSSSMSLGIILQSIQAPICALFPAVIFEIVQQASLRIPLPNKDKMERGASDLK